MWWPISWAAMSGIYRGDATPYTPSGQTISSWQELVAFINQLNESWVLAARRISSRVLCDLLAFTGPKWSNTSRPSIRMRWALR